DSPRDEPELSQGAHGLSVHRVGRLYRGRERPRRVRLGKRPPTGSRPPWPSGIDWRQGDTMASDMLGRAAARPPSERPLSISQVTAQVRLLLEERFARVWVEGEISNWTRHAASGHCYFALKD